MNNRYAALLENYRQYDHLTLALAGISLLAVLVGLFLNAKVRTKMDHLLRGAYFVFVLIVFILVLAGAAYILRNGGQL